MGEKQKRHKEVTSLNQWVERYKITKYKDREYESLMDDPEVFGATLANSTIDRLLKKKDLTSGSA